MTNKEILALYADDVACKLKKNKNSSKIKESGIPNFILSILFLCAGLYVLFVMKSLPIFFLTFLLSVVYYVQYRQSK